LLASRLPPIFQKSNESPREGRNVEWEIFETLTCVVIVGEGLKEILRDFSRHFSLLAPAFVINSDSKEEKQVEKKCRNPTLRKWEDETHTLEIGTWESSRTFETSKFNYKGQNTLHCYGSLDVENGLAWAIWTSTAHVMAKKGSRVKLPV
jgi:hypothetical protein